MTWRSYCVGVDSEPRERVVCVFCGGSKLTREHVLPAWMSKYFADLSGYVASGWIGADESDGASFPALGSLSSPVVGNTERRVGAAGAFSLTVGRVCRTCNNGWMADLEADVEPILGPMFGGDPQLLVGRRAERLATWAVKTVLVATLSWAADLPVDPFHELYRDQHPSQSTTVWSGYRSDFLIRQDYGPLQSVSARPSGFPDGYHASLILGHVVLGVVSYFAGSPPRNAVMSPTYEVAIWPNEARATTRTWPPPQPLTDERLARWIYPPNPRIPRPR